MRPAPHQLVAFESSTRSRLWERTRSTRSWAVGPRPHSTPSPEREMRSLPSVTLARRHPSLTVAQQTVARQAHLVEEDLVEGVIAGHVDERDARSRPSRPWGRRSSDARSGAHPRFEVRASRMPHDARCA